MELKMIENILNKYVIEAPSMGRSVILADRIDEVADDIRQFLLQQTPCCTQSFLSTRQKAHKKNKI